MGCGAGRRKCCVAKCSRSLGARRDGIRVGAHSDCSCVFGVCRRPPQAAFAISAEHEHGVEELLVRTLRPGLHAASAAFRPPRGTLRALSASTRHRTSNRPCLSAAGLACCASRHRRSTLCKTQRSGPGSFRRTAHSQGEPPLCPVLPHPGACESPQAALAGLLLPWLTVTTPTVPPPPLPPLRHAQVPRGGGPGDCTGGGVRTAP